MSVSFILVSGFMFLGGLFLLIVSHDLLFLAGVILSLMGVIPLILYWFTTVLLLFDQKFPSKNSDKKKEHSHEDSRPE